MEKKKNVKETLEARVKSVTPGDLRKHGILCKSTVESCSGTYVYQAGSSYGGEYTIGRDC